MAKGRNSPIVGTDVYNQTLIIEKLSSKFIIDEDGA